MLFLGENLPWRRDLTTYLKQICHTNWWISCLKKKTQLWRNTQKIMKKKTYLNVFGHFLSHLLDNVKKLWKSNIKKYWFLSIRRLFPLSFPSLLCLIHWFIKLEFERRWRPIRPTFLVYLKQNRNEWMFAQNFHMKKYDLRFSLKCFSWVFWYDVLQSKSFERYPKHCALGNTVS